MWMTRTYNDGGVIQFRPVFYNGKHWIARKVVRDHAIMTDGTVTTWSTEHHFTDVYPSNDARFPRAVH